MGVSIRTDEQLLRKLDRVPGKCTDLSYVTQDVECHLLEMVRERTAGAGDAPDRRGCELWAHREGADAAGRGVGNRDGAALPGTRTAGREDHRAQREGAS